MISQIMTIGSLTVTFIFNPIERADYSSTERRHWVRLHAACSFQLLQSRRRPSRHAANRPGPRKKHVDVHLKLRHDQCRMHICIHTKQTIAVQHHKNAYALSSKCKCIAVKFFYVLLFWMPFQRLLACRRVASPPWLHLCSLMEQQGAILEINVYISCKHVIRCLWPALLTLHPCSCKYIQMHVQSISPLLTRGNDEVRRRRWWFSYTSGVVLLGLLRVRRYTDAAGNSSSIPALGVAWRTTEAANHEALPLSSDTLHACVRRCLQWAALNATWHSICFWFQMWRIVHLVSHLVFHLNRAASLSVLAGLLVTRWGQLLKDE